MSISRWLLVVGAVLAVMFTASFLAAPSGWAEAQQWADRQEEQRLRQLRPCPVLVGTAESGEMREEMAVAASLAKGVDRAGRLAGFAANLTLLDGELAESDRSLLHAMQPAVLALRKAARQRGTSRTRSPELLEVIDLLDACNALLAQAYVQRATDPNAACEQLLDGARIAAELMQGVTLVETAVGAQILERCLVTLGDTMLPGLPGERLQWLEKALREVDASLPEDPAMAPWYACDLVSVVRDPERFAGRMPTSSLRAWRYGFSENRRLRAVATSVVEAIHRSATTPPGATVPWSVRRLELEQATRAVAAVGLAFHEGGGMDFVNLEQGVRRAAAQVRLVRLAVAFSAGSELPTLRDPLGDGDFLVKVEGYVATFASAEAGLPVRKAERR